MSALCGFFAQVPVGECRRCSCGNHLRLPARLHAGRCASRAHSVVRSVAGHVPRSNEDLSECISIVSSTEPPSPRIQKLERAVGVDFGAKRTGVAVSTLGLATRPLPIIDSLRRAYVDIANDVLKLALAEDADGFVVGIPLSGAGCNIRDMRTDSRQGRRCRNFAITLAAVVEKHKMAVFLVDESGSSYAAAEELDTFGMGYQGGTKGVRGNRRGPGRGARSGVRARGKLRHVDSTAAAIILETYFDAPAIAVKVSAPGFKQRTTAGNGK